jgi:hypothetical protein
MFSLITKITHSQPIKDSIAILRGIYRVASARSPQSLTNDWIKDLTIQSSVDSLNENKADLKIVNHLELE